MQSALKQPLRPRGYPLVGQLPKMARNGPALFRELTTKHWGEVLQLDLGVSRIYLTTHPDHAQHVLMDNWRNYTKATPMWRSIKRLLGAGLATADGDTWFRNRRLIQPLFSSKQLVAMVEQMIEVATAELEPLADRIDGAPVEMDREMMRITQRVILATMFGTALSRPKSDTLAQAVLDALGAINIRLLLYFVPETLLPGEARLRRALATMDEGIEGLITERRAQPSDHQDLLSLLIGVRDEDGERMSDRQLRDELVTIFVAGNETTAVAMTWLFYRLDRHPEIDARVQAELDQVLGDRPLTFEGLQSLEYSRRVIQETLRMHPPTWLIPRNVEHDDDLCGYAIPAGSTVVINQYALHYDEHSWESPDQFDPDRFLPERAASRSRCAYIPFGSGPRQCIGNNFAMMEALVILAVLRRRVRARLVPGHVVVPQPATTLRPKHGLKMTLHPA